MWKIEAHAEYVKRAGKWPKKHRREFEAMHDNLDTFYKALLRGAKLEEAVQFGFVHGEGKGIKAIDQKGAGAGVKQTRLYIFPDKETRIVHLITIGDKDSQDVDVKHASDFVDELGTQQGE